MLIVLTKNSKHATRLRCEKRAGKECVADVRLRSEQFARIADALLASVTRWSRGPQQDDLAAHIVIT